MALLPDPELMVLDEPTTGMDVEGRRDFWNAIRADAQAGRTVLFATHYLEEADAYADRIVLVRQGRVVADGTAARGQGPGRRPDGAGDAARRRPGRLAALPGVDTGGGARRHRAAARQATPTRSPATCSPPRAARDLEITSRNLEDAFLALTSRLEDAPMTAATAARPSTPARPALGGFCAELSWPGDPPGRCATAGR